MLFHVHGVNENVDNTLEVGIKEPDSHELLTKWLLFMVDEGIAQKSSVSQLWW